MNSVLLLHGALGSKTQLDPFKKILEAKGREVHSMNFSGHSGISFEKTFGIETFADDVLKHLNEHKLSQVDIFGYSMGGYVATWLAHLHSNRVGTIVTLGTKFDWNVESAEHEVKKLNPEKILEKVPAFARILENRHAPNDWKELLHKTAAMMTGLGAKPLLTEPILQSIKNKVFVMLGDKDDMANRKYSERVASLLPDGKFELLAETIHPIEKVNLSLIGKYF